MTESTTEKTEPRDPGPDIQALCEALDMMVIESQFPPPIVLSAICMLFGKWILRTMCGDKESAINSFRQNGISSIESAIDGTKWESTTVH